MRLRQTSHCAPPYGTVITTPANKDSVCVEEHLSAHFQYGATIFLVRHRGYSLEQKCDVSLLATLNSLLFTTQGTCCRRVL